jgi:hypothetical protein
MSLFQLYETQRRPFAVGKKWICVDPGSIGFPGGAHGEIIEVIRNGEDSSRYKVLSGRYEGAEYHSSKSSIRRAYEPYTEP